MVFINKNVSDFYKASPLATEKYVETTVSKSGGGSWGKIKGDIEDQEDLTSYISSRGGGGGSKISDWDNSKVYSTDEVVAVGDLNNKTIYRSLEDNNETDPTEESIWEYIADISDVVEYDKDLEWVAGDLVILKMGVESAIFKAIYDNTGDEELIGNPNWELISVMTIPEEWEPETTYDNYMGTYHTSVKHNNRYWRTFEENIGIEPFYKSWEIITDPLISGDGITIVNGKVNLGGNIESENVSIHTLEVNEGLPKGSSFTITKNYSGLGIPGAGMQSVNGSLERHSSVIATSDYLSIVSQNKSDIFQILSSSVSQGFVGERYFMLSSDVGIENREDSNRRNFQIINSPTLTRMAMTSGGGSGEYINISTSLGGNISSGIQLNNIRIGSKVEDKHSLLTELPTNSSTISVTTPQGGEIFKIHGDGRVSGSDAVNDNEFTTLGQLNSSVVRLDRVVQDIEADINTQNFKISESSKVIASSTKVHLTRATANDELFIDDGNIRLTTMSGTTGLIANYDLITLGSYSLKLIVDPVNYNIKLDGDGAFSLTTHPNSLNWTGYNHSAICNIGGLQLTNDETTPMTIKVNGIDYITFDNGDMTIPVETVVSAIQAATPTQIDAIKLALGI